MVYLKNSKYFRVTKEFDGYFELKGEIVRYKKSYLERGIIVYIYYSSLFECYDKKKRDKKAVKERKEDLLNRDKEYYGF